MMDDRQTFSFPSYQANILLVEDNALNRKLTRDILLRFDCHITLAVNGQEAIEKFQEADFALVFMDCHMPVLDGLEASKAIREIEQSEERQPTPIIALTGSVSKLEQERLSTAGMDDLLTKPFTVEKLNTMLMKYLSNK